MKITRNINGEDVEIDIDYSDFILEDILEFTVKATDHEAVSIMNKVPIDTIEVWLGQLSEHKLRRIAVQVSDYADYDEDDIGFETGTLVADEKLDLLRIASDKYTLQELEERLGGTIHTL